MDKGGIIVIVLGLAVVAAVAVFALSRRGSQPVMLPPATSYNNLETWEISWNADGLPERVEIHREAKQTHA